MTARGWEKKMTNDELQEALGLVVELLKELAIHDHQHRYGDYYESDYATEFRHNPTEITDDRLNRLLELFPEAAGS